MNWTTQAVSGGSAAPTRRNGKTPTTCISTFCTARKNARSRDCRHASASSLIQQWPTKRKASKRNKSRRNSAPASARNPPRRPRVQSGGRAMTKKRGPKKPKIVWVGGTPITPITAKESRRIDKRIRKHREKLRKRYPEVHGKVVDYISHSIDDGTLFFSVAFKDKT